jgi:hypothetical protein
MHLQLHPDRPEAEEPDAVLALEEELAALLGREVSLARVADVRRHVGERLGPLELGDHALAVVAHTQGRYPAVAHARDRHGPRLRVERVLHQLGECLPRVGLGAREPADQLEGIGGAEAPGADVGTGLAAHRRRSL